MVDVGVVDVESLTIVIPSVIFTISCLYFTGLKDLSSSYICLSERLNNFPTRYAAAAFSLLCSPFK